MKIDFFGSIYIFPLVLSVVFSFILIYGITINNLHVIADSILLLSLTPVLIFLKWWGTKIDDDGVQPKLGRVDKS